MWSARQVEMSRLTFGKELVVGILIIQLLPTNDKEFQPQRPSEECDICLSTRVGSLKGVPGIEAWPSGKQPEDWLDNDFGWLNTDMDDNSVIEERENDERAKALAESL